MSQSSLETMRKNYLYFKDFFNFFGREVVNQIYSLQAISEALSNDTNPKELLLTPAIVESNDRSSITLTWMKKSNYHATVNSNPQESTSTELRLGASATDMPIAHATSANNRLVIDEETRSRSSSNHTRSTPRELRQSPLRNLRTGRKRKSSPVNLPHRTTRSSSQSKKKKKDTTDEATTDLAFIHCDFENAQKDKNIPKPRQVGLILKMREQIIKADKLETLFKHKFHNFAIRDPYYQTDRDLRYDERTIDHIKSYKTDRRNTLKVDQVVKILDFPAVAWSPAKIVYIEGNLVEVRFTKKTFEKDIKTNVKGSKDWKFSAFDSTIVTNIDNPFILTEWEDNHKNSFKNLQVGDFIMYHEEPLKITKVHPTFEKKNKSANSSATTSTTTSSTKTTRNSKNCLTAVRNNGTELKIDNPEEIDDFVGYGARDPAYLCPENYTKDFDHLQGSKRSRKNSKPSPSSIHHQIKWQINEQVWAFDFGGRWERAYIQDLCLTNESILLTYPSSKCWSIWTKFDNPHLKEGTAINDEKLNSHDFIETPYRRKKIKNEPIADHPDINEDDEDDKALDDSPLGKNPNESEVRKTRESMIEDMALRGYKKGNKILARWRGDKEFYPASILKIVYADCLYVEFADGLKQNVRNLEKNITKNPTRDEWEAAIRTANNKYGGAVNLPLYPTENEKITVKMENLMPDIRMDL